MEIELIKKEPYRSIFNLLLEYQGSTKGLEQRHMRYALIKNHDNLHKYSILEMERFFNKEGRTQLDDLYRKGIIKKNVLSTRNNLTNKLAILNNVRVIKRVKRGKKKVYLTNPDYEIEGIKQINYAEIGRKKYAIMKNVSGYDHFIYGLGSDIFNDISSEKQREILNKISVINEILNEVQLDIQSEGMKLYLDEFKKTAPSKIKNNKEKLEKLAMISWLTFRFSSFGEDGLAELFTLSKQPDKFRKWIEEWRDTRFYKDMKVRAFQIIQECGATMLGYSTFPTSEEINPVTQLIRDSELI